MFAFLTRLLLVARSRLKSRYRWFGSRSCRHRASFAWRFSDGVAKSACVGKASTLQSLPGRRQIIAYSRYKDSD
jgi:hypothetical protein